MLESKPARRKSRRWLSRVTRDSDALDLEASVFKKRDPKAIAQSLKRSAERSGRRKSEPFRSAMSMLNFYINRAGRNLPQTRKRVLERAKDILRELYGREPAKPAPGRQPVKRISRAAIESGRHAR